MNKLGHLVVGFGISSIFISIMYLVFQWYPLSIQNLGLYALITFIFCLLPDIDHKMSSITWLFLGIGIIGVILSSIFEDKYPFMLIISVALLLITFVLAKFAPHRGFVHTIWFGGACACLLYYPFHDWSLVALAGLNFYSHLVADGYWFKLK